MQPASEDHDVILSSTNTNSSQTENWYRDVVLNILLVGDSSVGKTALARAFTSDPAPSHDYEFLGVTLFRCYVQCCGFSIRVQIWDSKGFNSLNALGALNASMLHGFIYVFDMDRPLSFVQAQERFPEIGEDLHRGIPKFLIGTTKKERYLEVDADAAEIFAAESGVPFYLTSPTHNIKVTETLHYIVTELLFLRRPEETLENPEEIGYLSGIRDVYDRFLNWIRTLIVHVNCCNARHEDSFTSDRVDNDEDSPPYQRLHQGPQLSSSGSEEHNNLVVQES